MGRTEVLGDNWGSFIVVQKKVIKNEQKLSAAVSCMKSDSKLWPPEGTVVVKTCCHFSDSRFLPIFDNLFWYVMNPPSRERFVNIPKDYYISLPLHHIYNTLLVGLCLHQSLVAQWLSPCFWIFGPGFNSRHWHFFDGMTWQRHIGKMKRSPSVQLLRLECGGRKIESEQKQGSEDSPIFTGNGGKYHRRRQIYDGKGRDPCLAPAISKIAGI